MKKLLLSILCLTLLVSATFFASGCKNSVNKNSDSATDTTNTTDITDTSHTHTFSVKTVAEKYLASEATCVEKAKYYYSCPCGEKGSATFAYGEPLNHSFTNYVSDSNATYEKDGTKTAHCDHKGCTATKTIPDEGSKLESKMSFKTLSVNGDKVYGKVSNNTETFSFINEIEYSGLVKYFASFDIYGKEKIETKTISLKVGDNKVYITELLNDEPKAIYEVTIRRRPVYTVVFKTEDGTILNSQTVEEDSIISEPSITRVGYTFVNCDYDFSEPITQTTVITTNWTANTDTAYKIEYYLETLDNGYTLYETDNLQGTTDSFIHTCTKLKTYDHFYYDNYYNRYYGYWDKRISGDGSTVLKVFYTRNTYTLSNKTPSYGNITNATTKKYGSEQINSIATEYLGCEFIGWFNGEKLLSTAKEYSFTVEYNVTAEFKVKEEMLNFSFNSSVDICDVTGVNDKTVSEIVIPDYVTDIESSAFKDSFALQCITLPFIGASKTAEKGYNQVLGYIFGYTISHGSAINGTICQYNSNNDFYCYYIPTSLKTVILSDNVTSICDSAFYNCSNLTNVTIPDSVTFIGNSSFRNCSNLTSVTIGNGVSSIGQSSFENCSNLTNVTIPESVVSIDYYAFRDCDKLEDIHIADLTAWCKIPKISNLMSYGSINKKIFLKNKTITDLRIPDGVTNIGKYAFEGCCEVTSVTIPNSVTTIENYAFYGCVGLNAINVDTNNINYYSENNCLIEKTTNTLILGSNNSVIPTGVTSISDFAFSKYINLSSVIIPDSVASIGNYAFCDCSELVSIVMSDSVISIGDHAFYNCNKLTSIIMSDLITSIGDYVFYNCTELTDLTMPNSLVSIGDYAFYNCSKLTSITIPKSVINIGNSAFLNCKELTEVFWDAKGCRKTGSCTSFTDDNTAVFKNCSKLIKITFGKNVKTIPEYAFLGCSSLTSITVSDSVTNIWEDAFYGCYRLEKVNYLGTIDQWAEINFSLYGSSNPLRYANELYVNGELVTEVNLTSATKISDHAFDCYNSLTSIIISDSVKSIGSFAFRSCRNLTSITIPNSVTTIGSYAFEYCSSLARINYLGRKSQWDAISKDSKWLTNCSAILVCSNGQFTL